MALVAAVLVAVAGCEGGERAAVRPAARCEPAGLTSGRHAFEGRSYLLTLPDEADRPVPLIFDFHGLNSSAVAQSLFSRLAREGPRAGFAVVEPETAAGRKGWKMPGMRQGGADVGYVGRLLTHLEQRLCLDRRRVYAAGFSNGAGLAAALVCGLRGRVAGVAAVGGVTMTRACADPPPVTMLVVHGTADAIIPYGGGPPFGGRLSAVPAWMRPADGRYALPSVPAATRAWARAQGCAAPRRERDAEVVTTRYDGCRDGADVTLHTVEGAGHAWPGSFPIDRGVHTRRLDATRALLDAFA